MGYATYNDFMNNNVRSKSGKTKQAYLDWMRSFADANAVVLPITNDTVTAPETPTKTSSLIGLNIVDNNDDTFGDATCGDV